MTHSDIIIVSGHYPTNIKFTEDTKKTIENYCNIHGYTFYYDQIPPIEKEHRHLHYNRCSILERASIKYPDAKWFLWLDTDVFVNRTDIRIESVIDLSNTNILYHLFHERPYSYPVNTGVKFVNKEAIKIESDIWKLRNDRRWGKFPFEQKVMSEKIIKEYKNRIIIHDPYILNCIEKFHQVQDAVFVHLCSRSEDFRNKFMGELLNEKQLGEEPLISNYTEYLNIIKKIQS